MGAAGRELAGGDPEGSEKGGFNPAHSNISPTQTERLGRAESQFLQLSSRQMARIFLELPARWARRPSAIHRQTDTEAAAQVSRVQGAQTHGEREAGRRGEAGVGLKLLSTAGCHLCSPLR